MTVADILARKGRAVTTAAATDTVEQVCAVLAEHKIGAVVVVSDHDRIEGIVSERDIVRAISKEGHDALSLQATAVMTTKVVTCREADTINAVIGKMTEGRFRHMPVTEEGRLVGLVSIGDIVKEKIAQIEADAEQLRTYIHTA